MVRDTASKASPTFLLFSDREKSTITSTISTMMSINPNILEEKTDGTSSSSLSNNHHARLPKFAPKHTHRKPKDITKGEIFLRILLQKKDKGNSTVKSAKLYNRWHRNASAVVKTY